MLRNNRKRRSGIVPVAVPARLKEMSFVNELKALPLDALQ